MEPITWTNITIKLGNLIPWPRNPRLIFEEEAKRLVKSYKEFNQSETILIEPGDDGHYGLLNGHQRLKVWGAEFGPELEVACRLASRRLTEKEKEKLTIYLHKGTVGRFDMDLLSGWETEELIDWGFSRLELGLDPGGFGDGSGDDGEPDGDQPGELPPATGELLALTNVTIAEPRHKVEPGQVWSLGHHVLICASVINNWAAWLPYLEKDCLFVPYPGPFVALSDRAEQYKMILVQPDPYIAGHILDRYADIGGEEMVELAVQTEPAPQGEASHG